MLQTILIKSCTIVDPNSAFNQKELDVLITDGKIAEIAQNIIADALQIDGKGKFLAPGFFDMNTSIGEPGLETKEDFETGSKAAAAGGFTGLAVMPHNAPTTDSKSQVAYIINRAKGNLVDIFPYGTISQKREGKDLSEMFDMKQTGAIAFSDGDKPVQDAGLMERALLYAKGFDALILSYPEDQSIAGKAKMNEGVMSTLLGMKGIPNLAEELMVIRDLYLAEYTGSKVHFSTISTAHAVELIAAAKAKGTQVTCDVAAHHLVLTEDVLADFDSHYKVKPPLRTQNDVNALVKGLKDGVIDAVVSQHTPQEIEFKEVEFEIASYGIIGLQTVLPLLFKAGLNVDQIVNKLAIAPRQILGLTIPQIKEGNQANVVLFNDAEWLYSTDSNYSKSANSPFLNEKLNGKVWLTCNNNQIYHSN
ncbi:dihydroorotase [Pedobacter cryophilus]|uniref:dihydroorotase n=1 Tax=Pedobacter cryophilus TaxID=2571271 RepID=UPI0019813978|nr:dihydroorotase [Pedobacter cryophilus]